MKNFIVLFLLILLANTTFASVEVYSNNKKHPIDVQLQQCLDKNYTTAEMNSCLINSTNLWLDEMNKYVLLINENLDKNQRNVFIKTQKAWLKYYNCEKTNIFKNIFTQQGTINTTIAYGKILEITKERTIFLEEFYKTLSTDNVVLPK